MNSLNDIDTIVLAAFSCITSDDCRLVALVYMINGWIIYIYIYDMHVYRHFPEVRI